MSTRRPVLVVDFGAQYAQLIARRIREAGVYSEIVPHTVAAQQLLERDPAALVLSGGPSSVYEPGAPQVDPALLSAGVPVLGICYGFQAMAAALGGMVEQTGQREFGATPLQLEAGGGQLLGGLPRQQTVWMSHGDRVTRAPAGFTVTASTAQTPVAAFEDVAGRRAGVQFHPEVAHTEHGQLMIEEFLRDLAGLEPTWTPASIIDEQVAAIRAQVGSARVICGLSGGVDSAVAAALVQRAVGDQLSCVFVDHGLLRAGEAEQVEKDFVAATGVTLHTIDAAPQFLAALAGVTDPEAKRKIIGREFIRAFEAAARAVDAQHPITFLVQGTLYPDVVESGGGTGTATIKSHHNVGGLPKRMRMKLVEPLRFLFKDEVRRLGRAMGLPESVLGAHPF
ncbi:MAG: glutamine-hydrolyzing GMP synthase, partial [Sporichthyaceae bacterium]|nr:glutamine-hydrolyzing GMP synthase [Sporichthyaceae bacterium]